MTVRVIHADCRGALREMADASIDACVTDPPYALVSIGKRFGSDTAAPCKEGKTGAYARASRGFMGKTWDTGEVAFDPATWREVLRVLKPGAYLIAFGGTRTYHRLACAVEDAGFEIRDMIAWLYGSGFPKSHDVSKGIDKAAGHVRPRVSGGCGTAGSITTVGMKPGEAISGEAISGEAAQWQGWGTALKPALEPIVLARKPLIGTVAANVLRHSTGALNIDASRVGWASEEDAAAAAAAAGFADSRTRGTAKQSVAIGKESRDGTNRYDPSALKGRWPANVIHDGSDDVVAAFPDSDVGSGSGSGSGGIWSPSTGFPAGRTYGDGRGSAARFFYSAKADAVDRLESKHPTVKPVDLIAYLIRLITPPGGTVLDPFAGSGTLGMACMREGFDAILIEREAEYIADIRRRINHVQGNDTPLFGGSTVSPPPARVVPSTDGSRTKDRPDGIAVMIEKEEAA